MLDITKPIMDYLKEIHYEANKTDTQAIISESALYGIMEQIDKEHEAQVAALEEENAKLRRLARLMWNPYCTANASESWQTKETDEEIRRLVCELGVRD